MAFNDVPISARTASPFFGSAVNMPGRSDLTGFYLVSAVSSRRRDSSLTRGLQPSAVARAKEH